MLHKLALDFALTRMKAHDILNYVLHKARLEEAKAQANLHVNKAIDAASGHIIDATCAPPVMSPEAASALVCSAHQSLTPLG